MKVKSESEVAQLCPTLPDPMDCSLPGSSDHGIFQARVLEWVAIAFSGFQGKPFNITVIQVYAPTTNAEEAEVEWFYGDLQDLLELTPKKKDVLFIISLVQFSSVAQLCLTLCDPMNHSMPGLPVHHQLLEFTQTHVHQVGDAVQPSHPLSSPSPPAPNPSQHQSLFQ